MISLEVSSEIASIADSLVTAVASIETILTQIWNRHLVRTWPIVCSSSIFHSSPIFLLVHQFVPVEVALDIEMSLAFLTAHAELQTL